MTNELKAQARELLRSLNWEDVSTTNLGKKMELWRPPDQPKAVPFSLEAAYHMVAGRPEKKTRKKKGK